MKKLLILCSIILTSNFAIGQTTFQDRLDLNPDLAPFYHGVASGDALTDRVIIWTRITPDGIIANDIEVEWKVATDTLFTNIVASGISITNQLRDFTVKLDVTGLAQNTWYFYYFKALGRNSLIGRTRTMPTSNVSNMRIAAVSGSNYNAGYFNVYRTLANRNDIDAIYHLGDYTYEYATGYYGNHQDRTLMPEHETVILDDYRMRLSHYRLDPDLRIAHQQYPWYVIWDDHETANNSWKDGAENHDSQTQGDWDLRKHNGVQAYLEWMPIREIDPQDPFKIYRKVSMGNLADVFFLETRLIARDSESMDMNDPNKTMLGAEQYNWLVDEIKNSTARWKIIAQQVMMAPLEAPLYGPVNKDQWDGFQHERNKLLTFFLDSTQNVVVLTGDIHTSWAMDIPLSKSNYTASTGQGSVAVEFVTPSVTSASFAFNVGLSIIKAANPWIKYVDITNKGYFILDITNSKSQADWYFVNSISQPTTIENFSEGWYVSHLERSLQKATLQTERVGVLPIKAPISPIQYLKIEESELTNNTPVLIGTYPNPYTNEITLQIFTHKPQKLHIEVIDINGKTVYTKKLDKLSNNELQYTTIDLSNLTKGTYIMNLVNEKGLFQSRKIIKK
jgi:alkaline phosphatase D